LLLLLRLHLFINVLQQTIDERYDENPSVFLPQPILVRCPPVLKKKFSDEPQRPIDEEKDDEISILHLENAMCSGGERENTLQGANSLSTMVIVR
jgi:hypothetical protein